eukprot:12415259-Karenia_brevis.AAC.1
MGKGGQGKGQDAPEMGHWTDGYGYGNQWQGEQSGPYGGYGGKIAYAKGYNILPKTYYPLFLPKKSLVKVGAAFSSAMGNNDDSDGNGPGSAPDVAQTNGTKSSLSPFDDDRVARLELAIQ